jgi:hypothetical protein
MLKPGPRAQGNCTDGVPGVNPPLRTPLRALVPLQCLIISDKPPLLVWQPSSVLLDNLYFRIEHADPHDTKELSVISVVPATNISARNYSPVRAFLTGCTLQGDRQASVGLRVIDGGRVLASSARLGPPLSVVRLV